MSPKELLLYIVVLYEKERELQVPDAAEIKHLPLYAKGREKSPLNGNDAWLREYSDGKTEFWCWTTLEYDERNAPIRQAAEGGSWYGHEQKNKDNDVVQWTRQRFSYKKEKTKSSDQMDIWSMIQYTILEQGHELKIALCKIYQTKKKKYGGSNPSKGQCSDLCQQRLRVKSGGSKRKANAINSGLICPNLQRDVIASTPCHEDIQSCISQLFSEVNMFSSSRDFLKSFQVICAFLSQICFKLKKLAIIHEDISKFAADVSCSRLQFCEIVPVLGHEEHINDLRKAWKVISTNIHDGPKAESGHAGSITERQQKRSCQQFAPGTSTNNMNIICQNSGKDFVDKNNQYLIDQPERRKENGELITTLDQTYEVAWNSVNFGETYTPACVSRIPCGLTYTTADCPVLQSANFPYSTPGTSIIAMNYNPMNNLNTVFPNVAWKASKNNFGHQEVEPTSTNAVSELSHHADFEEQQETPRADGSFQPPIGPQMDAPMTFVPEMSDPERFRPDLQSGQPNQPEQISITNIDNFHHGQEFLDGINSQITVLEFMPDEMVNQTDYWDQAPVLVPVPTITSIERFHAPQELMDSHQNQIEVQGAPSIPSGTLQTEDFKDQTGASNTDFSTPEADFESVLKYFASSPYQFSF